MRPIPPGRALGLAWRAGPHQRCTVGGTRYDGARAPVAQWTERGRPKACVGGSSPSGGTTRNVISKNGLTGELHMMESIALTTTGWARCWARFRDADA